MPETGCLYVIQVIPEIDQTRIKIGYTTDLAKRVKTYRCICPTLQILITWECSSMWEESAIIYMTRDTSVAISNEVFVCHDLKALLQRGDTFFTRKWENAATADPEWQEALMLKRPSQAVALPGLRRIRLEYPMGIKELAATVGINPSTINNIERGIKTRQETALKLAKALNVPYDQLLNEGALWRRKL